MLSPFDWLRRCRSGEELLATIRLVREQFPQMTEQLRLGPPHSALESPCKRCLLHACAPQSEYCPVCKAIIYNSRALRALASNSVVVWGYVNVLPKKIESENQAGTAMLFVRDEQHFLRIMLRKMLAEYLREIVLYDGHSVQGVLQIFPTVPAGSPLSMGEALCWVAHHERFQPIDKLYVRFHPQIHDTVKPHLRDRQGILAFEISEFINFLDMAQIFRTQFRQEEQKELFRLLKPNAKRTEHFSWGRLLGELDQGARDLLTQWNIRQWPPNQIKLLRELLKYVTFSHTN